MRLALNMAKMAKEGCSHTIIQETRYLIKKLQAEVREETKWGIASPEVKMVTAAIARHPAMLRQHHTAEYLPCHSRTE